MGKISMPQGKGSQLHNKRSYEKIKKPFPDNIDKSRTAENIIFVDKNLREAYDEIFGKSLEEYNARQKRADRKINDYCEHIKDSKNGEKLFYEDVIQWGRKEDFTDPENVEKAKKALTEYAETFQERNKNLIVIGSYLHMDEASPHLHIDYIPVAHGYKRGLETRNSINKAMSEMGFAPDPNTESRKNNSTKLWKENERAYFGELCRKQNLHVEEESKARGSLSVEEYKRAKTEMIGSINEDIAFLHKIVQNNIKNKNELEKRKKELGAEVRKMENKALLLENRCNTLQDEENALNDKIERVSNMRNELTAKCEEIEKRYEDVKSNYELACAIWNTDDLEEKYRKREKDILELSERKAVLQNEVKTITDKKENLLTEYAAIEKMPPKQKVVTIEKNTDYKEKYNLIKKAFDHFLAFLLNHNLFEKFDKTEPELAEKIYKAVDDRLQDEPQNQELLNVSRRRKSR